MNGSGVLIGKNKVLTVAHNIYNKYRNIEAEQIKVFIRTDEGEREVLVKEHIFH